MYCSAAPSIAYSPHIAFHKLCQVPLCWAGSILLSISYITSLYCRLYICSAEVSWLTYYLVQQTARLLPTLENSPVNSHDNWLFVWDSQTKVQHNSNVKRLFLSKSEFSHWQTLSVSCQSLYSDTSQAVMKWALLIFVNSEEIEVGTKRSPFSQPDGSSNSNQNMQMICSHFFPSVRLHGFQWEGSIQSCRHFNIAQWKSCIPFWKAHLEEWDLFLFNKSLWLQVSSLAFQWYLGHVVLMWNQAASKEAHDYWQVDLISFSHFWIWTHSKGGCFTHLCPKVFAYVIWLDWIRRYF